MIAPKPSDIVGIRRGRDTLGLIFAAPLVEHGGSSVVNAVTKSKYAITGSAWKRSRNPIEGLLWAQTVNNYINLGTAWANLGPVTFEFWTNLASRGENSFGVLAGKNNGSTDRFTILCHSSNALQFVVDYATTDLTVKSNTNFMVYPSLSHYVVTWDGSANASGVIMYRNAVAATSYLTATNASGARVDDSAESLFIANRSGSSDLNIDGSLFEFRIYNRVKSPAEIAWTYANPWAIYQTAPRRRAVKAPAGGSSPQSIATGQATETDSALAATVTTAVAVATGQSTETDSALAATVASAFAATTGQAQETDTPLAATVTAAIAVATGQAAETDAALAATAALAISVATGQATETDEALPLLQAQAIACGQAEEVDEALGCEVVQSGESNAVGYWYRSRARRREEDVRRAPEPSKPRNLIGAAVLALLMAEDEDYGL